MKHALRLAAALAVSLSLQAAATAADTSVYFQPGVSTTYFTGDVGRYASGSVGISATQGIQFGLIGGFVSLATDFHLTDQPAPPYARGLQTFTVATGLRLALPVRLITPIIGLEYANVGVVANPLIEFTGSRSAFNAVGGHLAARWMVGEPFYVEAQVGTRYFVDMRSPTASISGTISFGLSGEI